MEDEVQLDARLTEVQSVSVDAPVPCERLIGAAGTGKTWNLISRVKEDPTYGLLTSTTGISAVNLGAITVHSTLRYSTTEVLRDIYLSGRLARTLHSIAKAGYKRLVVEEYSMSDSEQLDYWYRGLQEANRYQDLKQPMGLLLVGDLAQLPPVKAQWCFYASCWHRFADNTTRLQKVWRQDAGPFLEALNLLREGKGGPAMEVLDATGIRWETIVDTEFQGTTILPKNQMVNRYNIMGLDRIRKEPFKATSRRWGQQRPEWGLNSKTHEWGIPPSQEFKIGALVTITANRPDFSVVNGDGGEIVAWDPDTQIMLVHILRTGQDQPIWKIVRHCDQTELPAGEEHFEEIPAEDDLGGWIPKPHYRGRTKSYVLGQIEYLPVKLNYASTVHKSQSLTLDLVQVDFRDHFFSQPAMLYVALSRARSLAGLRLVGSKERFVKQCAVDERILPWL
jgi:hypothetical protein